LKTAEPRAPSGVPIEQGEESGELAKIWRKERGGIVNENEGGEGAEGDGGDARRFLDNGDLNHSLAFKPGQENGVQVLRIVN